MPTLKDNLDLIVKLGIESLFMDLQRGIEKESLRVGRDGALAMTPHPSSLGSALTNSSITTDYSEAQLEFVSPVLNNIDALTNFLTDVHHFTYQNIGDEKLWANSMPCIVHGDQNIPIARYGHSNVGKMKEAYRRGLGHRYGRLMQTICGIHYNFSLPTQFWPYFLQKEVVDISQNDISVQYLNLVRNFHRHGWLLIYLFGASPAVCKSFLKGRSHTLQDFANNSYYSPYATSLRMSDLGYSNQAQNDIKICYNELDNYTESLIQAMHTPYPEYERIGVKVNGDYRQLNANLLQIENEFYASIRPKRVIKSGERATTALMERGIEYVEVRSIDLNPFVPIGIDQETIGFLDLFLLFCLLENSPEMTDQELKACKYNNNRVVMRGREPGLTLDQHNKPVSLQTWATQTLDKIGSIAGILDTVSFSNRHSQLLTQQKNKISDSRLTPSGKIINDIETKYSSYFEFASHQSQQHELFFKHLVQNCASKDKFASQAKESIMQQTKIEQSDICDFDQYLTHYFKQPLI